MIHDATKCEYGKKRWGKIGKLAAVKRQPVVIRVEIYE